VGDFFKALNGSSLFVMLFLVANVVYHPFQVLRAETDYALTGLPIQDFPIRELVIDVVRTRAFNRTNPFAD
jgi:hypothetical protein